MERIKHCRITRYPYRYPGIDRPCSCPGAAKEGINSREHLPLGTAAAATGTAATAERCAPTRKLDDSREARRRTHKTSTTHMQGPATALKVHRVDRRSNPNTWEVSFAAVFEIEKILPKKYVLRVQDYRVWVEALAGRMNNLGDVSETHVKGRSDFVPGKQGKKVVAASISDTKSRTAVATGSPTRDGVDTLANRIDEAGLVDEADSVANKGKSVTPGQGDPATKPTNPGIKVVCMETGREHLDMAGIIAGAAAHEGDIMITLFRRKVHAGASRGRANMITLQGRVYKPPHRYANVVINTYTYVHIYIGTYIDRNTYTDTGIHTSISTNKYSTIYSDTTFVKTVAIATQKNTDINTHTCLAPKLCTNQNTSLDTALHTNTNTDLAKILYYIDNYLDTTKINTWKTKNLKANIITRLTIHLDTAKTQQNKNTLNNHTYTFHNKKTLLKCGDIESNPGPRITLLSNHPQIHLMRQKTYFYNKTTKLKPEYKHILDTFIPYLSHTQNINTNPHLIQFCRNHNHCPKSYTFYALLITLAPTPTQCNQLIENNSTQWTTKLIKNLLEWPNPIPTDQHTIINFHLENTQIINPQESIQKELYSFITNEQPNLTALQKKFPYLPEKMIQEALKCLQPIPNYTHPNITHTYPSINPQNIPYTNPSSKIISWNYGTLNTARPGLQAITNKTIPPAIIAI